jgi:hypothetical protein
MATAIFVSVIVVAASGMLMMRFRKKSLARFPLPVRLILGIIGANDFMRLTIA